VPNFSSIQFGFCCFYWGCARECPFMYLTQWIRKKGQLHY
jgi:hypothetical protein